MNCAAPTVSNVPDPPSFGRLLTSTLTPVSRSMVFRYSRRLSRRMVILPPESANARRATTMVLARSSRKSAFSVLPGCSESSGGISPEFNTFSTFCHRSASSMLVILNGSFSRSTFPSCVLESWQSKQCALKNARCLSGKTASGGAAREREQSENAVMQVRVFR